MRKYARKSPADRFWPLVDRSAGPDECWPWLGGGDRYGLFSLVTSGPERKLTTAHRAAWILTHGPIAAEQQVCHRCDVPKCCNPAHLFLGTQQANIQDAIDKGRMCRGDRHHMKQRPPQGERNINARLTAADIAAIRAAAAAKQETQRAIAVRFGITESTVSGIVLRKSWTHL